jgi:hypothetical protein
MYTAATVLIWKDLEIHRKTQQGKKENGVSQMVTDSIRILLPETSKFAYFQIA